MASLRESKLGGTLAQDKERYNSVHVQKRFSSQEIHYSVKSLKELLPGRKKVRGERERSTAVTAFMMKGAECAL